MIWQWQPITETVVLLKRRAKRQKVLTQKGGKLKAIQRFLWNVLCGCLFVHFVKIGSLFYMFCSIGHRLCSFHLFTVKCNWITFAVESTNGSFFTKGITINIKYSKVKYINICINIVCIIVCILLFFFSQHISINFLTESESPELIACTWMTRVWWTCFRFELFIELWVFCLHKVVCFYCNHILTFSKSFLWQIFFIL